MTLSVSGRVGRRFKQAYGRNSTVKFQQTVRVYDSKGRYRGIRRPDIVVVRNGTTYHYKVKANGSYDRRSQRRKDQYLKASGVQVRMVRTSVDPYTRRVRITSIKAV
jgi:hypothetical protein